MKILLAAAFALLGTVATAQTASPMAAHDAMAPDAMASVPAAAKTKIAHCKAMPHDAMAKSATCLKMKTLYPAAFDTGPMVN